VRPEFYPIRPSVITHAPITWILGKHTSDRQIENVEIVGDNVLVDLQVNEETCEYGVSNPQGLFNLSIPHKQKKTGNYQQ
jgi:hypothetical protein